MPVAEPDVWGLAYCDAHAGKLGSVVLRRDDGQVEEVPEMVASYFGPPADHQVELLGRLTGRVLDIGCGVGRHLLWLQERRIEAVGIDNSPGAIAVARQRGCREVHLGTVAEVDFPAAHFDAAIMLANNAGLGGTVEGSQAIFRRLARWVRLGGWLIAESRDPLQTDDPVHLAYHEANRRAGRPPGQVRMRLEYGGQTGEWIDLMLFEPAALEQLLAETGWRVLGRSEHAAGLFVVVAEAVEATHPR